MHTDFYEVFYLKQTIILCYEVSERNVIIETTAVHFFKKFRCLSLNFFSTNYTEHNMNLKGKET